MSSGLAPADGADLYFERRGTGSALLLITGGGGDCAFYSGVADILASDFTVLTYDRRGNSRSKLHGEPRPLRLAEQSADAVAVLRANGFAAAQVFGSSAGATVALDLAARHPAAVTVMVCHEPPIPTVLPAAAAAPYLAVHDEMDRLLRSEGWQASFRRFRTGILGQLTPERIPPGPLRELMLRMAVNWEFMTRYEIRSFIDYRPDFARIRANGVRIALAYGDETTHLAAAEMSRAAAALLSAECAVVPGAHAAPLDIPAAFAAPMRELLARTLAGQAETRRR